MRKTDNDVKEIVEKVSKILQTPQFQAFSQILYGHGYMLLCILPFSHQQEDLLILAQL